MNCCAWQMRTSLGKTRRRRASAAVTMPTRTLSSASSVSTPFTPDIRRRLVMMTSFPPEPDARGRSLGGGGVTSHSCSDCRLPTDSWGTAASIATTRHVTPVTSLPTETDPCRRCKTTFLLVYRQIVCLTAPASWLKIVTQPMPIQNALFLLIRIFDFSNE